MEQEEIGELEELDYRVPEDGPYAWEDRVTDTLNMLIRYVKKMEEERK